MEPFGGWPAGINLYPFNSSLATAFTRRTGGVLPVRQDPHCPYRPRPAVGISMRHLAGDFAPVNFFSLIFCAFLGHHACLSS
nr:hypothetical protein Itr_chr02CG03110 [Ipomoea trifida]